MIVAVRNKPSYRMGNKMVNIICYADEAVLIANNEDNLQRILHQFHKKAKEYNMEISTQKK